MTNAKNTLVAVLVDRSGSMRKIQDDTEGGLQSFLESQREDRKDREKIEVWLSDFSSNYTPVYSKVDSVPGCKLRPAGNTIHTVIPSNLQPKTITTVNIMMRTRNQSKHETMIPPDNTHTNTKSKG